MAAEKGRGHSGWESGGVSDSGEERERVAMWGERSGGGGFEILFSFLSKEKGTEDAIEYAPIQSSP